MSSELYGRPYRFAVVHSSALDRLRRYKSQIEVENLFRALKHPYFVHGFLSQK
jgi:uncharacterized protein YmfQ (DUF2313 family)